MPSTTAASWPSATANTRAGLADVLPGWLRYALSFVYALPRAVIHVLLALLWLMPEVRAPRSA